MNVKHPIVVIVGGGSGIGCTCAEQFLSSKAEFVAILDLPDSNGRVVADTLGIQHGSHRVDFFACDVTKDEQVHASFDKIAQLLGSFDILINSAGVLTNGANWQSMIDVNFTGLVRTTLKAIDLMGKHRGGKGGTIVNISSLAGLTPVIYYPIYAATKHAIVGLTNSLALSYNETGVRMMLMCPGRTHTPFVTNLYNFENPHLNFINVNRALMCLRTAGNQQPECVAKAIIRLMEKEGNGAICLVHDGQPPYVVNIPTLDNLVKRPL
ncbi:15-hydroxyprostaglandin dehydrogenase [NAD(+)]-like [Bombus vancouverensis nearcticus]|uniref:15-hydroxyprostaglandin dehydrogenase [NAD(+)]-like n=1 Tax=Bombus vancouverensis nearcticus TaxID=2705178 RepID=UPI001438CDD2|nr:15-hydroxyprostaglandin dehydrogenase [NAD(+)]-like [Bombus vancouverensis nearcticus]